MGESVLSAVRASGEKREKRSDDEEGKDAAPSMHIVYPLIY